MISKTAGSAAKRLKKECGEIESVAVLLLQALERNQAAIQGFDTGQRLKNILQETQGCVAECNASSLNRIWEILWRHRLPDVTKKLLVWVAYFTAETTVC